MTASKWPAGQLHPAQRRYLAEDLVRLRRSDEQRRYAAPQRAGKIDANPHQVEAVVFALARHREGGCILADEVGLGKTIEAGLVIRQLLAEGARRILLVAPKPLLGQWRQELFQLFGIEAREGEPRMGGFDGDGVFLIGREASGSAKGAEALHASEPFDLCVIDEAHEVFAGIYKRFDKWGVYNEESPAARTAGRLRDVLQQGPTPVLLLTATPIQNSLTELWGLVQYVDPNGTLLGDLPTFREVFCGQDDRTLAPGLEDELRRRLRHVVQRTLRRQAQEFLDKPFVPRQTKLFDYTMSPDERSLYDDVTSYLLEPNIAAFQGNQRRLLLITFLRLMGSSQRALAASLENVASRLRKALGEPAPARADDAKAMLEDLEDEDDAESVGATETSEVVLRSPEQVRAELSRVERFIERACSLPQDSKALALQKAVVFVTERAARGEGSGKIVLFTESVATQEYLRDMLIASGLMTDADITLFRGTNDSPRAREALERWEREVVQTGDARPSRAMAVRLALVHEFKTRSKVFISTEAGAKGLNLQFCETVINYDLPWNPQRIEQRVGRCHRYGQKHQVTVINFLAKDNEAQQLTFDILSQKLELFGTVLDASDEVLHRPEGDGNGALVGALGAEFENELRRIYDRARTLDEITEELRALREKVAERRRQFEETHERTAGVIEERFDEEVRRVFKLRKKELPEALAELDRDLERTVTTFLDAHEVQFELTRGDGFKLLRVSPSPVLPEDMRASGGIVAIGPHPEHVSLHLGHALVVRAIADARAMGSGPFRVKVCVGPEVPDRLAGRHARLILEKLRYEGFEREERLLPVAVLDDGETVHPEIAARLLASGTMEATDPFPASTIDETNLDDAVEEVLFDLQRDVDDSEHRRFERALEQAERYIEDRIFVRRRLRSSIVERLDAAMARRDAALASSHRDEAEEQLRKLETELEKLDAEIERLERREDPTFQRFRDRIHARRYAPPTRERLFEMDVVIA